MPVTIHQRISSPSSIDITRCIFFQCTSTELGGAIFAADIPVISFISYSSFTDCTSDSTAGGAIYMLDTRSSFFFGCCFTRCFTIQFANAMLLGTTERNDITSISVVSCYTPDFPNSYNIVEIYNYTTIMTESNSTSHKVTGTAAGCRVYSTEPTHIRLSYLTILENTGSSISVVGANYPFTTILDIAFVNFVRNEFTAALLDVRYANATLAKVVTIGNTASSPAPFDKVDGHSSVVITDSVFDQNDDFVCSLVIGRDVIFSNVTTPQSHPGIRVADNDCHNMCSAAPSHRLRPFIATVFFIL